MDSAPDVEAIARGLYPADRDCLLDDDPHHVRGSAASLMSLCLQGLADPQTDNSIALNDTGLAVRRYLESRR